MDIEAELKRCKQDQERFKDYTKKVVSKKVEFTPTSSHNTLCSTCNVACHAGCGLEEVAHAGDQRFLSCAAFSGNSHCQVCGGATRCTHNSHYHARKIPNVVEETLEEVLQDVKENYDKASDGVQQNQLEITKLNDSKQLLENAIAQHTDAILSSCEGIKTICKNFNFAEELQILVDQLEIHRRELTDITARKAASKFIESIKAIIQNMHSSKAARNAQAPVITPSKYTCRLLFQIEDSILNYFTSL